MQVFYLRYVILIFLFSQSYFGLSQSNSNRQKTSFENVNSWITMKSEKGFLENKGQLTDMNGEIVPSVLFKTEAPGLNFWITETGVTIQTFHFSEEHNNNTGLKEELSEQVEKKKENPKITWERIDIELKNASIMSENIVRKEPVNCHSNYFYPNCPNGLYNVREYKRIEIKDVYQGIDWVFYRHSDGSLKYDFVVHKGADYHQIQLLYQSRVPVSINPDGQLELYTDFGNILEKKPISFQQNRALETVFLEHSQKKVVINGVKAFETLIGFDLEEYDPALGDVVIDPELVWGTFYGGNLAEGIMGIETDDDGNLFVVGYTISSDFPIEDPLEGTYFQGEMGGDWDMFILKFTNNGDLLWSTYYGGDDGDLAVSVTTNHFGEVFITGRTSSADFPILDPGGSTYFDSLRSGFEDAFILKFTNEGIREWGTYYGGSGYELARSISTDSQGNIYVTGLTLSFNFPIFDPGGGAYYQGPTAVSSVFILKFDRFGERLWGTYYGGNDSETGTAICTDSMGNIFVTGQTTSSNIPILDAGGDSYFQDTYEGGFGWAGESDAFILKFDENYELVWATYYGGNSNDVGLGVGTDHFGNLFVTGFTRSSFVDYSDLPLQDAGGGAYYQGPDGNSDWFILKFDSLCVRQWATYYGGPGEESYHNVNDYTPKRDGLAINNSGEVYMSLCTRSEDLPVLLPCEGGFIDNSLDGPSNQVLVKFENSGKLSWATYIGGNGKDVRAPIAVDNEDNIFIAGEWTVQPLFEGELLPETYPLAGSYPESYYDTTYNGGVDDSFLMKFVSLEAVNSVDVLNDSICNCGGRAIAKSMNGTGPFEFNWSNGESETGDLNTDTLTNLCVGDYWVAISNACGLADTLTFTIGTDCELNVLAVNDTICGGECIDLTTSVFYESGELVYDWGEGIVLDGDTITVCPEATTVYTVVVTDDIGSDSTSITVVVLPNPTVNLGSDTIICDASSFLLNAENPETQYIWQNGDTVQTHLATAPGTYWVEVDLNGCVMRDSIEIFHGYMEVDLGVDTILCNDDSLILVPTASAVDNYLWHNGSTDSIFAVTEPGVFWVEVTDTLGCLIADTVTIGYSIVNADFSYQDTIACRPLTTFFEDNSMSTPELVDEWIWDFGDGNLSTEENPAHNYETSGTYHVSLFVRNSFGCYNEYSKLITITIHDLPVANFSYDPVPVLKNETVYFKDSSINATSWYWDFGNGDTSFDQNPTTIYEEYGIAEVTLVVANEHLCTDSTLMILAIPDTIVYHVPNVFTPNGDGINDFFFLDFYGKEISDFNCIILNRWGIVVGRIDELSNSWSGDDLKGNPCPDGVYFFKYEGRTEDDSIIEGQGAVTLIGT